MNTVISHLSKQSIPLAKAKRGDELQELLFQAIQKEYPDFEPTSYIALDEIAAYRKRYISQLMLQEADELGSLEKEVIDAIAHNTILSENIEDDFQETVSLGQKLADRVAEFGGSWTFVCWFFVFFMIWIGSNVAALFVKPFDPYPFILLNLILSCLAAIQAPIIMMSQNRKEEKDRKRSEHDYKVNLKAELEIRMLNDKMDHLMIHQNQRLLQIQQLQIDYLEDILKSFKPK